jgi:hypothetical protein
MHGKNLQGRITRLQELIMRLWHDIERGPDCAFTDDAASFGSQTHN